MQTKYLSDNSFLFRLTKRFTLFLLLQAIVLIILYVTGNYQNFLDSTLRFIMLVASLNFAMLSFFSLAGLIESFCLIFITKKKKYIAYLFAYIILIFFACISFIILRGISFVSSGLL